jgi:hypothetical protein
VSVPRNSKAYKKPARRGQSFAHAKPADALSTADGTVSTKYRGSPWSGSQGGRCNPFSRMIASGKKIEATANVNARRMLPE